MNYDLRRLITELRIFFNNYIYTDKNYADTLLELIQTNSFTPVVSAVIEYTSPTHVVLIFEKKYEYNVDIRNAVHSFYKYLFSSGDLRKLIETQYTGEYKNELLQMIPQISDDSSIICNMYNMTMMDANIMYIYL